MRPFNPTNIEAYFANLHFDHYRKFISYFQTNQNFQVLPKKTNLKKFKELLPRPKNLLL